MLKLKTVKVHEMMIAKGRESNPAMAQVHWPKSPTVTDNPKVFSPVEVKTWIEQDAILIPIEYLKDLIILGTPDGVEEEDEHGHRKFLLSMVDVLANDQRKLKGTIVHDKGERSHYTPKNYVKKAKEENEIFKAEEKERMDKLIDQGLKEMLFANYKAEMKEKEETPPPIPEK